jgi:hypothetical protein
VRESTASPAQNYEVKTRLLDVAQYLSRRNSFGHLGRLHPDSGFLRRATDSILAIVEEFIVQRLRYLRASRTACPMVSADAGDPSMAASILLYMPITLRNSHPMHLEM